MSINSNNNIEYPKPRWFDGILYRTSPSPVVDVATPTRQSSSITNIFSSRPPTHSPVYSASIACPGSTTNSPNIEDAGGRRSNPRQSIDDRPSWFRSSLTDVVSESERYERKESMNLPAEAGVHMNMSPLSEISVVQERERDVQSIQIDDDISYLLDVKLCDTTMFTPSIQYGKVIHILSGSELLLAARIYNGYTKVLGPKLYCFRIRLRDVSWFGTYEDMAKEELKRLILDKIVLLTHTNMVIDGFVDAKVYLLHMNHLKNYLKYGRIMNITNGDGNLYVNETINNYIRLQS